MLAALPAFAGLRDPAFETVQFDQWTPASQTRLKWSVEVPAPELSTHQRIMVRVIAKIDGRELEKRRGPGELYSLLQLKDGAGQVWQQHAAINLASLPPNLADRFFTVTQYAFVKPGDYSLTTALCEPLSKVHSAHVHKLHVQAVKGEPLPHAFEGLPEVEFVPANEKTPDVWFIPDIESRLNLAVPSKHPLQLQVLVNTTPSEMSMGSAAALRRNMSLIIPAMKLLTGVVLAKGSVDVAFLDLEKHKIAFEQPLVDRLDWFGIRKIFSGANPGIVDVGALANEWKMRGYFLDEVTNRLRAPLPDDAVRVVIVLSGPAFFNDPNQLKPEVPVVDASRQLYYIRCRTLPLRYPRRGRGATARTPVQQRPVPVDTPMPPDDLERLAMGLNGRIFDATSTDQFRRILATILEQISAL